MMIEAILNDDGTVCDPPKNPLAEKWSKLYPPSQMPQYSQVCDDYSCMWCGRCPQGSYWKVPEEDIDVYNKYVEEYRKYMREHNPILYDSEKRIEYMKKLLDKSNEIKKEMGLQ